MINGEIDQSSEADAIWVASKPEDEKPESISNEQMVLAIKNELAGERPHNSQIESYVDRLSDKDVEDLWVEIGSELKQKKLFTDFDEGIDIFQPLGMWVSPYRTDMLSDDDLQEKSPTPKPIGGIYDHNSAEILMKIPTIGQVRESIKDLAKGYGLGGSDVLIHETLHGFQYHDPIEAQKVSLRILELEEELREKKSEKKTLKSIMAIYRLENELMKLRGMIDKLPAIFDLDSTESYGKRVAALEIYSRMFSNKLGYMINHCESKQDIVSMFENMIDMTATYVCRWYGIEGFEPHAKTAFRQIEALKALGISDEEIGRCFRPGKKIDRNGYFDKLQDKIMAEREKRNLTGDQHQALVERYEIELVHKAALTRKIASEKLQSAVQEILEAEKGSVNS